MKFIKTNLFNHLKESLLEEHGLIRVLVGPRQVGKTTTAKYVFEQNQDFHKYIYESADGVISNQFEWLLEIWQKARSTGANWLVIDEFQKIENWSEIVKKLHDEDRSCKHKLRCLLLGSSSLQIQKGLSESLTGRFVLIQAYHWNYEESKKLYDFNLDSYMKYGGYPGSYDLLKLGEKKFSDYLLKSIISTVIEKDILANHQVKSPALFKQAFEIICSYPAQIISYTKLLGQLQDRGNTDIVKYYLSLYEGAFLVKQIFKFSDKILLQKTSSPKIIPLCPVFYYLSIQDDYRPDEKGHIFEAIVGAALLRLNYDVFYWRDGKYEVDYILKRGRKLIAVEVKSSRRKAKRGLEEFCKRYPNAQTLFITPDDLGKSLSGLLEKS